MSGKDFYEGGDDPVKYYRPNTSTKGDFFVPPAGTTEGKMEEVSVKFNIYCFVNLTL